MLFQVYFISGETDVIEGDDFGKAFDKTDHKLSELDYYVGPFTDKKALKEETN